MKRLLIIFLLFINFYCNSYSIDLSQVKKLLAGDAQAGDEFGYSVSIYGDYAIVGAYKEDSGGTDAGAAYIFYRNQGGSDNWGQVKKITASDAQADDYFGISVSISGDYAIVGAYGEDSLGLNAGAAYIYYRNQGGSDNWGQVKKITGNDTKQEDAFGYSVSIYGDYAIVGAPVALIFGEIYGAVYIFYRNQGGSDNWGQIKKIIPSEEDSIYPSIGFDVSLYSDYAIVGAPFAFNEGGDEIGAAYIFYRNQGGSDNWGLVKAIAANDGEDEDEFGFRVSINGDYAIVGAYGEDSLGLNAGAAYIYYRNQGGSDNWGQVKKITANDAQANDHFGYSVSIYGNYAVIGAPGATYDEFEVGAAYIFYRNQGGSNNWGQIKKITSSDEYEIGTSLGYSVSIYGDYGTIGAPYDVNDDNDETGAAFLFGLLPTVTTSSMSYIGATKAVSGGSVSDSGSSSVTARGLVWSTSPYPTLSDNSATTGSGLGSYSTTMTGLQGNYTYYYVRAFATNSLGTAYGDNVSFTTVPTLPEWALIILLTLAATYGGYWVFKRFV